MIEHLPECLTEQRNRVDGRFCCCAALIACEQRVLDAAREAVAASWTGWCSDPTTCTDYEHVCQERHQALAAIDALRGER